MRECYYFSRSPEFFGRSGVCILNLLNLCKQMQLSFVLRFKTHKRCCTNFAAFVAIAQTRVATNVATLMFGKLV